MATDTKVKLRLEFELRSSPKILFSFLSSPSGLGEWFADNVRVREGIYTFSWEGESDKAARILTIRENKSIKFKWEDDEPYCFFEFEVLQDELTNDVALAITDFCVQEEVEERRMIWKSQVDTLSDILGA